LARSRSRIYKRSRPGQQSQMAEVAVPRQMFHDILRLIARLRAPPAPA
jgi:hypothetical protein